MDTLTLTDFDPSLAASLRLAAAAHGRSVEEEAADLIKAGLARSPSLTRRQRAEAISAMSPKGVVQSDSTAFIREDRDSPDR